MTNYPRGYFEGRDLTQGERIALRTGIEIRTRLETAKSQLAAMEQPEQRKTMAQYIRRLERQWYAYKPLVDSYELELSTHPIPQTAGMTAVIAAAIILLMVIGGAYVGLLGLLNYAQQLGFFH